MDIDTYLATNSKDWKRLDQLTKGGRRKLNSRSHSEIQELTALYQKTSSALSYSRSYFNDPALNAYLSALVNRAGQTIYGTRKRSWRNVGSFFTITFPAASWHMRKMLLVSALLLFLPALVGGAWIATNQEARDIAIPPVLAKQYIEEDFESYYRSEEASQFSSEVITNNIMVGVVAFGGGIALGLPTVFALILNGFNVGIAGGLFAYHHQLDKFFGLILPHGLLELTCVVFAGAAGLQLGWSIIAPGNRTRVQAIGEEGRRVATVVIGLFVFFTISGIIEGFVTGQPWPTWIRVGIGVIAEILFLSYVHFAGRNAKRQGYSGELGETDTRGRSHLSSQSS